MKIDWVLVFLVLSTIVSYIGAHQFIATDNSWWLLMMLPIAIWMEGAFVIGPALLGLALLVHWVV